MDPGDIKPTESPDSAPSPSSPSYIKPQARKLHDPDVTFEEYHYYALQTRKEQASLPKPKTSWREIILRNKPGHNVSDDHVETKPTGTDEENTTTTTTTTPPSNPNVGRRASTIAQINFSDRNARMDISDEEWTNASRAFRTATAGACFYLITTDILGPYGVGFAIGTLGWGPGIGLYTVFGFMAGYGGYLLRHAFLGLDSHQFPCKNYGDLAFRLYGSLARNLVNFLQALALLLILGQVTIQNGQALSQVSRFRLCYAVCPVLFIAAGFVLGQIRTLRRFGLIANLAIWLNLLVIFITMGVIAHSPPNYEVSVLGSAGALVDPDSIKPDARGVYPAVKHYNGLPDPSSLIGSINGLLSGVLAYGGAQLFIEFMAEMRRPHDFLKAMWGAQFFIYSVYMIYGCFVYYYQGQYSYQISYQGVSVYGWQTAGNMIALVSGLIAAALYGNIGIKVLYNNILMDLFNAPPLITKPGKLLWVILVPIWWSIAFIVAAAIPDYFGFVSVISSATLIHFTYSFPPILALAFDMQLNAIRADEGEGFDPSTGQVVRRDRGPARWLRGFRRGRWYLNIFHLLYAMGAIAMSGLGLYAAIEGMIEAFEIPQVNSFSCTSPLDLSASS